MERKLNNHHADMQEVDRIQSNFYDTQALHFQVPDAIWISGWGKPLWNHIHKLMGNITGKTLLDVGCGIGRESILFALRGAMVSGVDISEQNIMKAQEFADRVGVDVAFQVGNTNSLGYKDESFDIVFCRAILHHLPHPAETVERLSYLIKLGGILIAQEPKIENPIAQISRRWVNPDTAPQQPFRKGELEDIFGKFFNEVSTRYFYILSPLCFIFSDIRALRNERLRTLSFAFLNKIDEFLLKMFPLLTKYTWIEIIYGKKT